MDRHAIRITEDEYENLCLQILEQKAEFITRLSKSKTVWYIDVQGEKVSCIYHKKTSGIVTFCNNKWLKDLKKMAQQRSERLSKRNKGEGIEGFFKKNIITTTMATG